MRKEHHVSHLRLGLSITTTVAAVIALAASGETTTATKVGEAVATSPAATEDAAQTTSAVTASPVTKFKVGDVVALGDWELVVNSVTDPFTSSSDFDTPEGRYVAVDVTVRNTGATPETVSSFVCFEIRDQNGRKYDQTILIDGDSGPDGDVDPGGGVLTGVLYYDVPLDVTGLELRFSCDLFSSGSATVTL